MVDDGSGPVKPFSKRASVSLSVLFFYAAWFLANQVTSVEWKGVKIVSWFILILGAACIVLPWVVHRTGHRGAPAMIRGFATTLALFLLALHIRLLVVERVRIIGESMQPALRSGGSLWINKLATGVELPDLSFPAGQISETGKLPAFGLGLYNRGDIVVFRYPGYAPDGEYFIKRIIALPGDRYAIRSGSVYVNDERLNEPYLAPGTTTENRPDVEGSSILGLPPEFQLLAPEARYAAANGCEPDGIVPPNVVYVLGDNRHASRDSRVMGFVPVFFLRGKAF